MRKCGIAFDTLVDYQEGRADAATAEQVRTHLTTGCDSCQANLTHLGRILTAMGQAERLHVPQTVLDQAKNIFRERYRKPERVPLRARLVFDSRAGLALAGARGEDAQSSQILYETDTHAVDIWQEKAEGASWYLIGQIMAKGDGESLTAETVTLVPAEGAPLTAEMVGTEFHLPAVRPGLYELQLLVGEDEIILPDVLLGQSELS